MHGSPAAAGTVAESMHEAIRRFASRASIEITPHDAPHLPALRALLPAGTVVYVAHTPKLALGDVLDFAARVQSTGLRACAHLAARGLAGEAALRDALSRLRDAGCDRLLLIAGDRCEPAGPYMSTLEVLDSGLTVDYGMTTLAVAGHPEGNPVIPEAQLWAALAAKQAFATRTGTRVEILTQFGFDAQAMLAWSREVRRRGVELPVHAGLAGPTPLGKLIRYAMRCGIGASLKALARRQDGVSLLGGFAQANASPDGMLLELVQGQQDDVAPAIVQPHLFSFGGSLETAQWLMAVREGRFIVDGRGFRVD